MGIIYPDNSNRANRVQQLAVNIGSIQSEANDSLDRVDIAVNHQRADIDKILTLYGFKNTEELNKKLQDLMTPAERAAYEEQVKHIQGLDAITDKILESSTAVSFVAGVAGFSAAPIARILSTGALAASADLFGRGFRALLAGEAVGLDMMRAAFRTFRALRIGGEVSETATKIARFIRTAGTVLAILGVVLDGIILIYSAVEGAKQKDELQKAINSLCARRWQAKQLEDQLFATEAYCSQVSAFLVTYRVLKEQGLPDATIKQIMDSLLANVVQNLTTDLGNITEEKVWKQVEDIDKQSNVAWTDEDPSHEWVKAFIEAQEPLIPEQEVKALALSIMEKLDGEGLQCGKNVEAGVYA